MVAYVFIEEYTKLKSVSSLLYIQLYKHNKSYEKVDISFDFFQFSHYISIYEPKL